jgi:diguanylate cyclase (GGDEF)-like protein
MKIPAIVKRFFKFFTFTDIPIWQKLLIFAAAGIGWFIVIALIGLLSMNYVSHSSSELTENIVPQIKTGQKIIIMIRGANVSASNIVIHDDADVINNNAIRARLLADRASADLVSLMEGGTIKDYSDLNGELIEEFHVHSIREDDISEKLIHEALAGSQNLRQILDRLVSYKLPGIESGMLSLEDKAAIMSEFDEYNAAAVKLVTILGRFTSHISALQRTYTENIRKVLYESMILVLIIGLVAISLLIVFSIFLKTSMTRPLKAITGQIKGLSEGEVDLSQQLSVGSRDEIAELSESFNALMNKIHDMNTYKKVIEEDDHINDVYNRMAKVFYDNLGLDDILMYELESGKRTLQLINTPYSREELCCNREILIDGNLCRAKKTGHIVSSIAYPKICKQYLLSPEKYHVCVPILVGGITGGVVQFQFDKTEDKKTRCEIPLLNETCIERQVLRAEQYIKESSAVIEAKKLTSALRESSVRDQMTGLYNRRFLEEYVDTLISGVVRKGGMIGLLMCDLDYFKEVNDKHGHDVVDTVLKETADIISRSARSSDMVIRFGGEEFVVILTDAKDGEAGEVAERIRHRIEGAKVKTSAGIIQKTISIGYSEFPKDTENFWEAIKYADIAMYKAKESGRNKILRFEKEMWTTEAY